MREEIPRCPECFSDLERTHPKRSSTSGQILYYRRLSCTSCSYYEPRNYILDKKSARKDFPKGTFSLTSIEVDKIENEKANRFFPKNKKLLLKQNKP